MVLTLGSAGRTLIDGASSWDSVAGQALTIWNGHLGTIQFAPAIQSPGVGRDGDHVNQAFFNSTVFGQTFGSGVLAVTTGWYIGTRRTEADITFNNAISWDSYRGPLRFPGGRPLTDLRRVALHEFGHVLGLGHPDQAGQAFSAIMNSVISDLDNLTSDDITGAQVLYPAQTATFSIQPQSKTVVVGRTVTFSVAASGSLPMNYQWRLNGVNIPGATNTYYTISNVQASHAGNYTVAASNAGGTATSATAVLTVSVPPSITAQPQSKLVAAGSSVMFSVTASGTAPLSYQWYFSGSTISGATTSTYSFASAQPDNAGDFKVSVSNSAGGVDSTVATLTVQYAPVITSQPQSKAVVAGYVATFSVTANAVPSPSYQWYFNGSQIPGANGSTCSITNSQPANSGNYSAVVSNSFGSVPSATAVLTVGFGGPFPGLQITRSGDRVVLSWPASPTGFGLEAVNALPATNWLPVSPQPVVIQGQNVVTNAVSGGAKIYRLKLP